MKVPNAQLAELAALVNSLSLDRLGSSLIDKLSSAARLLDDGRPTQACDALDSFIAQVAVQTGNGIPPEEAAPLTSGAEAIKVTICPVT